MKGIIHILLFCFVTLTLAPPSLLLLNSIKSQCEKECVLGGDEDTCPIADLECCPGMCNPAQCCVCCFMCTVDSKKLEIRIFENGINKQNSEDQFDLSDFTSDCWQPPKKA